MKKKIITLLGILLLSYWSINNLDFLFNKVQVCNDTEEKINISIINYRTNYLENIFNILKWDKYYDSYEDLLEKKVIYLGSVEPKKCSDYTNTNRLYRMFLLNVYTYNEAGVLDKECTSYGSDVYRTTKIKLGTHRYSVDFLRHNESGSCTLYVRNLKRY